MRTIPRIGRVSVFAIAGVLAAATISLAQMAAPAAAKPASANASGADPLVFPEDYRDWTHTHTTLNSNKSDARYGFHNVYVNATGLRSSKAKGVYPDGSKLIIAFYDIKPTETGFTQGPLIKWTLMARDSKRFAQTAGWGFATFGPDRKPKKVDMAKDCFQACHVKQRARDYVFSAYVR